MKKILLFSACVMLAFSSCKKSDKNSSTASNTITVTVGSSNLSFNTAATAVLANSSGSYVLLVSGATGTGSNAQAISIAIDSENPIVKGTYTLNSSTSPDATSFPQISYVQSASTTNPVSFTSDITGTNASTITITSISSTNVQGTFNGVLVSDQDGTTTKSVTDGKFNVTVTSHP
jgi:hypothetical protein